MLPDLNTDCALAGEGWASYTALLQIAGAGSSLQVHHTVSLQGASLRGHLLPGHVLFRTHDHSSTIEVLFKPLIYNNLLLPSQFRVKRQESLRM